jgi:hypothetical protein
VFFNFAVDRVDLSLKQRLLLVLWAERERAR